MYAKINTETCPKKEKTQSSEWRHRPQKGLVCDTIYLKTPPLHTHSMVYAYLSTHDMEGKNKETDFCRDKFI